jgi:hypothetical protein
VIRANNHPCSHLSWFITAHYTAKLVVRSCMLASTAVLYSGTCVLFFSIGALDARLAIRPLAVRAFRGFEKHLGIRVDVHTIFYPLAAQMSFVERQGRRPEGVKTN